MNRPSTSKAPISAKKPDAVPLLDLQRQYLTLREAILAAIERVCASQHFILGAEAEALESELAAFCGAGAAVGCASGTDALWLSLAACEVGPGDAVITTPFSFFASASAIVRAGGRPVFVDIDPLTLNLDPAQVSARLRASRSFRIRALLPVHLFGQCSDIDALQAISDEFKLHLIEDAAQAIGASWRGRRAGSLGIAAAFSFYPTKNLSAYGDAGLTMTRDAERADHMRRLRNHGSPQRYLHEEFGWNARIDAIQAAVLRVKLPYVERWNELRRSHAARYDGLFRESGLVASAAAASVHAQAPVTLPWIDERAHSVFHQYVIRAHRRDELRKFLSARKIGTEIYYPLPLHMQPCFAYLGYGEGDFPVAERAAREVLALPMFPELTEEEQRWVVASIAEFYS